MKNPPRGREMLKRILPRRRRRLKEKETGPVTRRPLAIGRRWPYSETGSLDSPPPFTRASLMAFKIPFRRRKAEAAAVAAAVAELPPPKPRPPLRGRLLGPLVAAWNGLRAALAALDRAL